jgi:D-glycero-D-manno-heptose 1,7-bisphosphate phosphatase
MLFEKKQKAVFLDRDGTICEEADYPDSPEKIILFPFAAKAIKKIKEAGYKVIIITNQSGIARGYFTVDKLNEIHTHLRALLDREGAAVDDIYFCPHYPSGSVIEYAFECNCRKPRPGMIIKAEELHRIDLSISYVIGDKLADTRLTEGLPLRSILVKTGYGAQEAAKLDGGESFLPDHIAEDLQGAVEWILANESDPGEE